MDKIIINDTHNADSRTADEDFTIEDLKVATESHIKDVRRGMAFFAEKLIEAGKNHDHTKMENFYEEYGPLCMSRVVDDEFKADPWYSKHIFEERHHLNDNVPEDVDLIDYLEMLVDTVMAGRGRSGHLTSKYIEIDPKVLYRAYWNSVKKLNDIVQVANSEE